MPICLGAKKSDNKSIALCGTRYVIFDIQAWSFTRVNSLRLQSQCLAITAFYKASQKNKFHLFFLDRPTVSLYITQANCVTFVQEGANPRRTNTLTKILRTDLDDELQG